MVQVLPRRPFVSARFRRALGSWLAGATGWSATAPLDDLRIIEAAQGTPRPNLPFVSYQLLGSETFGRDDRNISEGLTSATFTVTASVVGESATLRVNRLRLTYVLQGGDGPTEARDALLTQLAASIEPVAGAAVGGAGLTLTPTHPGALVEVLTIDGVTLDDEQFETLGRTVGPRGAQFRIQLHAPSDPLDDDYIDVDEWIDAMVTSLLEAPTLALFRSLGVAYYGPRPTPTPATVPSGARLELRRFFTVSLSTTADLTRQSPATVSTVDPPTTAYQPLT